MPVIPLTPTTTLDDIVAVARRHERVEVAPETVARIGRAFEEAERLASVIPTYGRGTGFGANKTKLVEEHDTEHGMRLLRSSAVDAGDPLPDDAVRAMLAVRLCQLTTPGAGLRPEILPAVAEMLNANALPTVREFASIGTADLGALCGTALTLIGERPASGPLTPMPPWGAESALPFVSSNALTIGRAILASHDLRGTFEAALVTYALSFTGLAGNPSPLSPAVAAGTGVPCAPALADRLRALIGESGTPRRIQDPYGLRAVLPVAATFLDALDRLDALLARLIHAAQENPLFVFDEEGSGVSIEHNGNFLQAPLALAVDTLTIALAQMQPLAISRIRMMTEPDHTGLEAFLVSGPPSSSGIMMVEYVAASAYAAIHSAAQPNSLTTVVLSRGAEEDASFASEGVAQLERAAHAYRTVVAAELLVATRLLTQLAIEPGSLGSAELEEALHSAQGVGSPAGHADHDQTDELAALQALLPRLAASDR